MHPAFEFRRILIIGAGGFGREVLQWARDAWPQEADRIAGFLSDDPRRLDGHSCERGIIGDPATFPYEPDDACLLAIGIPGVRRRVAESVLARGGRFVSLIHPTAIVVPTASIGEGSIVCPQAIVSDSCRLGRFVLMNYHSSLGHDAAAGDFAVLSPYATLGGAATIAEDVFLGLHASVGPRVGIGSRSKIAANSCVLADAPGRSLLHGVPARVSPFLLEDAPS
jgi:sugar O-acyltransferase (sialic acid O-acetyltransferase NeuD family)